MIKVLFVCWGNICRSPMGEFILKDMVEKRGLSDMFHIESKATSTEEIGNPVYPPARAELRKHGISCDGHHARQIVKSDYDNFDYIIGMEDIHINIMKNRFFGQDDENKLHLCMEFAGRDGEQVDDPWYTGDFSGVYAQITSACEGLIERALSEIK